MSVKLLFLSLSLKTKREGVNEVNLLDGMQSEYST